MSKLDRRLKQSNKNVRLADLLQIMEVVGEVLDHNYRSELSAEHKNGLIIKGSKRFGGKGGSITLCRTFLEDGTLLDSKVDIYENNQFRSFALSGKNPRIVEKTPIMGELIEFYTRFKGPLTRICSLAHECHKIHSKLYTAHMNRKQNHETLEMNHKRGYN